MARSASSAANPDIRKALIALVMDWGDLSQLEARLSQFNVFRVLRADKHEIRHSNMLAWLLDPEEAHGLGDRFLRRWLMNVVHDAPPQVAQSGTLPSPIDIHTMDIDYVEVAREHENIDLLLVITTTSGKTWTVCIENKVESTQHSNQLRRYRAYVEHKYADAERRVYVFLTKYGEEPEEVGFIVSSHELIESVLRSCVEERKDAIGIEPRFLIDQYLKLLAEDFVDDSDSAKLARKIYKQHKKAIDFILENRIDPISETSAALQELIEANAEALDVKMGPSGKGRVRFVPRAWDVPENSGGTGWGPNSPIVLCELTLWARTIELQIVLGRAPDAWADLVWERAATAPFKQEWKQRPRMWVKPFKARSSIVVASLADVDGDEGGRLGFEWVRDEMNKPPFKEAVRVIAEYLKKLKAELV